MNTTIMVSPKQTLGLIQGICAFPIDNRPSSMHLSGSEVILTLRSLVKTIPCRSVPQDESTVGPVCFQNCITFRFTTINSISFRTLTLIPFQP